MLKKISYFLVLFSYLSFSQTITVDDTSYSATDLTNLLLNGSCIDPTNISYSSPLSVAQFDGNGSGFPLTEGIILRTGEAKLSEGIYTDTNLSSQVNSSSDPTLETISASTGQNDPITDTAFLQFDFVPISSDFSFDFIFASNEYGQWQCGFSDVFAFLLTDLGSGTTTNLAIVPGTTDPITVITIRDNTYNGGCTSENANLFDTYNVTNPAASTLNMRGHTTVLNASSTLTPGNSYRIRLVIGDYKNPNFDSAVFIDTGSFTTEIDLGEDATICDGNEISITTGLDNTDFTHSWTLDSTLIPGETTNTLVVTQAGTYDVVAIKNGTACQIPGSITISDLSIATPSDLSLCDNGSATYNYDLSFNDEAYLGLDPAIYNVIYFATQADIPSNPISVNNVTNYTSAGNNETIYIKILNIITGVYCTAELNFDLTVSPAAVASQPNDIDICESPNTTTVNLTAQDLQILGILNAADFTVTYYASQDDLNNQNSLGGSIDIPTGITNQEIWVLIVSNTDPNCIDTTTFNIIVNPLPIVSTLDNIIECSEYTLPVITDGVYYDGPGGTGNMLNAGDIIDEGGTYYIYNGPDENGCFNESSFLITLINEHGVDLHHCDVFSVPVLIPGEFYTETDGPNGTGTLIDPVTVFTSADLPLTVHYYAETTDPVTGVTSVCRNEAFDITIYDLPPVDQPDNIVTCLNYTFPALTNGTYYDASGGDNGTGNMLNTGDVITTSGTYYVYSSEEHNFLNADGTPNSIICENEWFFEITIINTPGDEIACGSFTLPVLETGDYFLQPNGQGAVIPQGSIIIDDGIGGLLIQGTSITFPTNIVDIYVFAADTENVPNCTSNMFFELTINPIPPVDQPIDELACVTTGYQLPALANGNYFDGPGGTGTPYFANDIITTIGTTTLYVYNFVNGCPNESLPFNIVIRDTPAVDNFTDVYECSPYELPALTDGNYYSGPNGTGTMYQAGEIIGQNIAAGTIANESIPMYIYNEWSDLAGCDAETTFTVYILGINLGVFENITACDTYTLPPLTAGAYYTTSGGDSNDLITNFTYDIPGTYTVYVYAENGIRDPDDCTAEESFTITISETPVLSNFSNEIVCGEFLLPALDNSTYDVNYYTQPGGNITDIININTPRAIPTGANTPYTETIYVYATATDNIDCFDEQSFTLTIHPLLNFTIDDAIICVDPENGSPINTVTLESNLNANEFTVNWYLNNVLQHTGINYETNQTGVYTVETIMIGAETPPNCNYNTTTVTVFESSTATATYTITEDFEDTATITVHITNGNGVYQYQLNDGPFQDSNEFHDVVSGDHIITINDVYGNCGVFTLPVTVLKYPKFFTPNGDGINDTWNIVSLSNQPDAIINIFDRFGKFIVQIAPTGNGWDGTYNNNQLPSTDYWFVVSYKGRSNEDKDFKAHFSLKR